jgi:hypothetical protein
MIARTVPFDFAQGRPRSHIQWQTSSLLINQNPARPALNPLLAVG